MPLRTLHAPGAARDRRPAPRLSPWRAARGRPRQPPGIVRPRGNDHGSRSDLVVREVRRGGGRVEMRDLRVRGPRARSRAPARWLRPVLHAAVRRLRPGRRPLHLHLNASDGSQAPPANRTRAARNGAPVALRQPMPLRALRIARRSPSMAAEAVSAARVSLVTSTTGLTVTPFGPMATIATGQAGPGRPQAHPA